MVAPPPSRGLFLLGSTLLLPLEAPAFVIRQHLRPPSLHYSSVEEQQGTSKTANVDEYLSAIDSAKAKGWSDMFGLGEPDACFFALFDAIRNNPGTEIGLRGKPFVVSQDRVCEAMGLEAGSSPFKGFFTFDDLAKAVDDDFLDAGQGTTDNRKGWKMTTVSNPRGNSFEEARMTLDDVEAALQKGTVIFNSAGAHIPKLAGPALACADAAALPNALNMYVTAPGKRTSAPPHTDKQDVMVVQTSGAKHWRVYSPPNPQLRPLSDMFARGKGDDNLPLFALEDFGCELLLETTLEAGDALFIPAAFPHTTDTAQEGLETTSIHLTFGLDTHIWYLDYLSLRSLALKRACVQDTVLSPDETNLYVGKVNELPAELRNDLLEALPMGLLEDEADTALVDAVAQEVERLAVRLDETTAGALDSKIWKETVERLQQHGKELLEIHRDMYLEAIEVGRIREAEAKMTAHLGKTGGRKTLTPEQMQRLSVFRVKRHFDKIEKVNLALKEWSSAGKPAAAAASASLAPTLPNDWQFTSPVKVGDEVEADLGGAFFQATVTRVAPNGSIDVTFFDGDKETGLDRSMVKLTTPPSIGGDDEENPETAGMTPKELKRWKKKQEKRNRKK